jgi:hypothetical protein
VQRTRRHRRRLIVDRNEDPMHAFGNLFDVALLIGLGFVLMALSSFGLRDLLSSADMTIVKNPGTASMQLITKRNGKIETLSLGTQQAGGEAAQAVGSVYRLKDGQLIWVPSKK